MAIWRERAQSRATSQGGAGQRGGIRQCRCAAWPFWRKGYETVLVFSPFSRTRAFFFWAELLTRTSCFFFPTDYSTYYQPWVRRRFYYYGWAAWVERCSTHPLQRAAFVGSDWNLLGIPSLVSIISEMDGQRHGQWEGKMALGYRLRVTGQLKDWYPFDCNFRLWASFFFPSVCFSWDWRHYCTIECAVP